MSGRLQDYCKKCGESQADHDCKPTGGFITMTYDDGREARIPVPASAMCRHKNVRALCEDCKQ